MALEHGVSPQGLPAEWSRSSWWTHPLFRSFAEKPSPVQLRKAILSPKDDDMRLWAIRSALFHVRVPGMRAMLLECFERGAMPEGSSMMWPHPNLRARFIHDEIAKSYAWQSEGASQANWLRALACCWPWLWKDDAAQQGMGESHPISRLIKAGYIDVLPVLYRVLEASEWLDWKSVGAEKMASFLMRRASVEQMQDLAQHDPSFLAWKHRKDGRTLLHEACAKLRPDVVAWLLARDIGNKDQDASAPALAALTAALDETRCRGVSRSRFEQAENNLTQIIMLLGKCQGVNGCAEMLLSTLSKEKDKKLGAMLESVILRATSVERQSITTPIVHRL